MSPDSKRDSSMTPLPTHDKTFEPSPPVSHDEVVGGESVNSSSNHCHPGSSLPHAGLVSAYAGLLITFFMAVYARFVGSRQCVIVCYLLALIQIYVTWVPFNMSSSGICWH